MPRVKVRNNKVDSALRVFKRKCSEVVWEVRQREYYVKPSEKRRLAKKAGMKRKRKQDAAKKQLSTGR